MIAAALIFVCIALPMLIVVAGYQLVAGWREERRDRQALAALRAMLAGWR
jgi:hypothetical protein